MKAPVFALIVLMWIPNGLGQQVGTRYDVDDHGESRNLKADVVLHLRGIEVSGGVPENFVFTFVNVGNRDVRLPPISPCRGRYTGLIRLKLRFSPLHMQSTLPPVVGCLSGSAHERLIEQAKSWKLLRPGESLSLTFSRKQLFEFQNAPGEYEFWAEYDPPQISTEEESALQAADIEYPSRSLVSEHLRYKRPE